MAAASAPDRAADDPQRRRHHAGARQGARAQGGRVPALPGPHRPRADADRARHRLGDVERALLVQILAPPPAHAADQRPLGDPGPGRERRRDRHRRRARLRLQDGEPQPPELHRALPGRGDRRRRHPARRVHHGGAADRGLERAALRLARPPEDAPSRRRRRRRHRRLRQFLRRADGRRRGRLPRALRRQHPRQRHGGRPREDGRDLLRGGVRRREPDRLSRLARPAATASTAPPWRRPSSTTLRRRSARPCRSAIPSPRSSCSRPASS